MDAALGKLLDYGVAIFLLTAIGVWFGKVFLPRLMSQFDKASERFEKSLAEQARRHKESEGAFLQALALQRSDFKSALKEQGDAVEGLRKTTERVAVQLARFNDRVKAAEDMED